MHRRIFKGGTQSWCSVSRVTCTDKIALRRSTAGAGILLWADRHVSLGEAWAATAATGLDRAHSKGHQVLAAAHVGSMGNGCASQGVLAQ